MWPNFFGFDLGVGCFAVDKSTSSSCGFYFSLGYLLNSTCLGGIKIAQMLVTAKSHNLSCINSSILLIKPFMFDGKMYVQQCITGKMYALNTQRSLALLYAWIISLSLAPCILWSTLRPRVWELEPWATNYGLGLVNRSPSTVDR